LADRHRDDLVRHRAILGALCAAELTESARSATKAALKSIARAVVEGAEEEIDSFVGNLHLHTQSMILADERIYRIEISHLYRQGAIALIASNIRHQNQSIIERWERAIANRINIFSH
jgi:hypothetical protein